MYTSILPGIGTYGGRTGPLSVNSRKQGPTGLYRVSRRLIRSILGISELVVSWPCPRSIACE